MIQILVVIWITLIRVRVRMGVRVQVRWVCYSPQDRVINVMPLLCHY